MKPEWTYDQHPPDRDHGPTILAVDDEELGRQRLKLACSSTAEGASLRLLMARNLSEALATLSSTLVHVVLLDKNLGDHDGLESIPELLYLQPHLQILMVTGSRSVQDTVRALKLGAFGYVTKESPDELLVAQISKAIEVSKLRLAYACAERARPRSVQLPPEMSGDSRAARQLLERAQILAENNRPVLLLGPEGSSPAALAEVIHSSRKRYLKQQERAFLKLGLAGVESHEAERLLFGQEDASSGKIEQGYLELANHGTLLIEQIELASPELQTRLARVLEDGRFQRLGGRGWLSASFKLICATRSDLSQLVTQSRFREDLYLKLSAFPIELPAPVAKVPASPVRRREALTLDDLLRAPLDVVGPRFPGLGALVDSLTERVFLDARAKHKKNKDIAKALKLSEGAISQRLKKLEEAGLRKQRLKMEVSHDEQRP